MFWGQQFPRLLSKKNMKEKKFNISLPSSQLETLCQPHLLCRLDEPDKAWGDKKTEGSCDIMAPIGNEKQPFILQVYNLAKEKVFSTLLN